MSVMDIKLGYECNNNCFHCVVAPEREEIKRTTAKLGHNYREVIEILENMEMNKYHSIILTGGEPTIRPDFLRIVKYIHNRYPDKLICIQTNGRMLWKYLDIIKQEGIQVYYVVAIHGPEEVHNEICNVQDQNSNPFQETMKSIKKIIELYGDFRNVARTETVLSRKNLAFMKATVEMLRGMGVNLIGISYPHLDGYEQISSEEAQKRGFSYAEMQRELKSVTDYAANNQDIQLFFEAVPICAFRESTGELYEIPPNILLTDYIETKNATLIYPERRQENFRKTWERMHAKFPFCRDCIINNACIGVWLETLRCFGSDGLKPITQEELHKVKETLKRHNIGFEEV